MATLLDQSTASARMIADQLGHSRGSMTQDVYLGRRASNSGNLAALEAYDMTCRQVLMARRSRTGR